MEANVKEDKQCPVRYQSYLNMCKLQAREKTSYLTHREGIET